MVYINIKVEDLEIENDEKTESICQKIWHEVDDRRQENADLWIYRRYGSNLIFRINLVSLEIQHNIL